jgi:hypothetical protein
MPYLLIQQTVEDYARWRAVFDEERENRVASGAKGARILHDAENPNALTVLVEFVTLEHARQYTQRPRLPELMQKAGIISRPVTQFLVDA